MAWSYLKSGIKDKAVETFRTAIGIYPAYVFDDELKEMVEEESMWGLYNTLGWTYYNQLRYPEAGEAFQTALSNMPDDIEAVKGLGYLNYAQKKFADAVNEFEKVLSKDPTASAIRLTVGWCWYKQDNYDMAIDAFSKVSEEHSDWVDAYNGLGWSYLRKENYSEAKKFFVKALKINPYYASSLEGIAGIK